ncbi:hypothetical protein M9458_025958, partial [Cirrhinus mrigala]
MTDEPSPEKATEPRIPPEKEPDPSDEVQELATQDAPVEEVREREGLEESPAHCTTAG